MVLLHHPLVRTVDRMTPQRWTRIALGFLIIVSGQIGAWALLAPRSFYDGFPGFGRAWVNVDGPFNQHLISDVGALNLALVVLFSAAWMLLTRSLVTTAGAAALAWGVPHAMYHVLNTDGLSRADLALSLSGLVVFAVVGGGLLWAARHLDQPAGERTPVAT